MVIVDPQLHELHLQAGRKAGLERTCGKKIPWPDEERANGAAAKMNLRPTTRNVLEAYPCPFCKEWHIGRKMSPEELQGALEVKTWVIEYWPEGTSATSIWPKADQEPIKAETAEAAIAIFAATLAAPRGRVAKAWELKQP